MEDICECDHPKSMHVYIDPVEAQAQVDEIEGVGKVNLGWGKRPWWSKCTVGTMAEDLAEKMSAESGEDIEVNPDALVLGMFCGCRRFRLASRGGIER